MAPLIQQNQETTISQGTSTNHSTTAIQVEGPCGRRRPRSSEQVPNIFVDEVDGKDGLQNVTSGNLTLIQNTLVFCPASIRCKVSFGNSTTNNGEICVGAFGCKFVADERVKPSGGDSVVLEGIELE